MRALALCLLLAGCVQTAPDTVLVCTIEGREVYRSKPSYFWKVSDGVWRTQGGRHKYQPSAWESCRTEESA